MYLFLFGLVILSCKNNEKKQQEEVITIVEEVADNDQKFGEEINKEGALTSEEMMSRYANLKVGDTIDVKFSAKVNTVCQKKGCWMRLNLGEKESFVKFKDYGFFMPFDIAGQEVIVEGKAFVEETSLEDLKHFALDAGKSQDEIDAITETEQTLSFISSGVIIPEKQ